MADGSSVDFSNPKSIIINDKGICIENKTKLEDVDGQFLHTEIEDGDRRMNEKIKLTFEQWHERYCRPITNDLLDDDGIVELIEAAQRQEYEFYINGGFDNL